MLRDYLTSLSLLGLPVIAMVMFLSLFLLVLWRVSRKARRQEYVRMANLPLEAAEHPVHATARQSRKGGQ